MSTNKFTVGHGLQLAKSGKPLTGREMVIYAAGYSKCLEETAAPELLEALNDLIQAHESGMGKKAIQLRIDIAKDKVKKATE